MHATVLTNVPFEPDIEDDGIIKSNIAGNQIFDMGIIYIYIRFYNTNIKYLLARAQSARPRTT
jgi:hypothetical protein